MRIQNITPEYAGELLSRNSGNRAVRLSHVKVLSAAISRGEWQMNGETVKISTTGRLLDGQHRLMAVIDSNEPVPMMIVDDISDDAFSTIDIGSKRTIGDMLGISGESNSKTMAAILRMEHHYRETRSPYCRDSRKTPSYDQIYGVLDDECRFALKSVSNSRWLRTFVGQSIAGWCFWRFARASSVSVTMEFFDALSTGIGLVDGSPILALRNRMMDEKARDKTAINQEYKTALIFKSFKLFSSGAPCKTLRVRTGGENAEKDVFDLSDDLAQP